MAQIGSFTLNDGKYTGTIRTMTINVKAQLVPNKTKASDEAPGGQAVSRERPGRALTRMVRRARATAALQ